MKIEEAIKRINEIKTEIDNWRDNLGEKLSERDVIDIQAYDIALQALEKQIPKPPTYTVHEKYKTLGKNYYCQCGVMFVDFKRSGTNYCGNCGQRLRD